MTFKEQILEEFRRFYPILNHTKQQLITRQKKRNSY